MNIVYKLLSVLECYIFFFLFAVIFSVRSLFCTLAATSFCFDVSFSLVRLTIGSFKLRMVVSLSLSISCNALISAFLVNSSKSNAVEDVAGLTSVDFTAGKSQATTVEGGRCAVAKSTSG